MNFNLYGANLELHHVFGSKRKIYKYDKAGEWIVLLLQPSVHADIKEYGFAWEQAKFERQKEYYEKYFDKPYPVPDGLCKAFVSMTNKQQVMKGFSPWGDDG